MQDFSLHKTHRRAISIGNISIQRSFIRRIHHGTFIINIDSTICPKSPFILHKTITINDDNNKINVLDRNRCGLT